MTDYPCDVEPVEDLKAHYEYATKLLRYRTITEQPHLAVDEFEAERLRRELGL